MPEGSENKLVITQEEIAALINQRRDEIIGDVVSGLVDSAKDSLSWEMRSMIEKTLCEEIKKIIAEEAPTITARFRDGLREQMISVCTQAGALIATAMIEKATKELQNSWTLEKITKEIF